MGVSYLVDSGASRDGLPPEHFPQGGPTRETALRSSNGIAKTLVQKLRMPRLLPMISDITQDVSTEDRDVLHIRGPPVLSMGRSVVSSQAPCAFIYAQGWQGFVYGDKAIKIRNTCLAAENAAQATMAPARNFIPRYDLRSAPELAVRVSGRASPAFPRGRRPEGHASV